MVAEQLTTRLACPNCGYELVKVSRSDAPVLPIVITYEHVAGDFCQDILSPDYIEKERHTHRYYLYSKMLKELFGVDI